MAVRRERIISLINAAFAYRNIVLSIHKALSDEARKPAQEQDLSYRAAELGHAITEIDAIYSASIETEFYRFKANENSNRYARERMAKLRKARGAVPRQHMRLPLSTTAELINPTVEVTITTRGIAPQNESLTREEILQQFNTAYEEAIDEGAIDIDPDSIEGEEESLRIALEEHRRPRRGVIGEEDKIAPLDPEDEDC